ncbi:MAG: cysteine methyltransferase [Flavobacteriales bacterium]|nr:cysteine methyltransferase [Flavobacteriales bacterium]|tara:strand:- start:854 stop:1213 length:360 start_codon:yes stop_codon:yes gene_type:complete
MDRKISEKNRDFFEQVYQVVVLIPKGRVTSYGAIANYLGAKSGARMVGWAMNAAHSRPEVPAHRVVNRSGLLTGKHHFPAERPMQEQLEAEGVRIVEDQVQEFDKLFWDPSKEIEDLSH